MNKKKILILGGGGNASVIAYAIEDAVNRGATSIEFSGLINDRDKVNQIDGLPVIGGLKDIPSFVERGYYFINTIGKIGVQKERIELIESLKIPPERYYTFVHPLAYIAPKVNLGYGCVVMPHATIQPNTQLGNHCRVMVNAVVGHNNIIGNHCFFAGMSCTGGYLRINDGVFVSTNSTIREFLTLEKYSTLGMGAVLTKNMKQGELWIGNPAKVYKRF